MIGQRFQIHHQYYVFSTYFLPKLFVPFYVDFGMKRLMENLRQKDGLKSIAGWHKRMQNPLTMDIILFPCHINGNHWCLFAAFIHFAGFSATKSASLFLLDSLGPQPKHEEYSASILSYFRMYWRDLADLSYYTPEVCSSFSS